MQTLINLIPGVFMMLCFGFMSYLIDRYKLAWYHMLSIGITFMSIALVVFSILDWRIFKCE